MTGTENPLEDLGLPKWLLTQAYQDGPDAIARLHKFITRLSQAAMPSYHPDIFPDDPNNTFRRITDAIGLIGTAAELEAWLGFYLDPASLSDSQQEVLRKRIAEQEAARHRALLSMLSLVDPFLLAGLDRASELLFGLPTLDRSEPSLYDRSFAIRLHEPRHTELMEIQHPDMVLSFNDRAHWDAEAGAWCVNDMQTIGHDTFPVEVPRHHRQYGTAMPVQLVGAVSAQAIPRLYEMAHPMRDEPMRVLGSGKPMPMAIGPSQASRLYWFEPDKAWWTQALSPHLRVGDYGVILRPQTGQLALVGRLLAVHSL